jgi:hypothetical protein
MVLDNYLNLVGEYRTAAELLKREIFATITYGNKKGADIYAIGPNRRTAVVEVKASNSNRFVTGFYQKYKDETQEHPDLCGQRRLPVAGQERRQRQPRHIQMARHQLRRSRHRGSSRRGRKPVSRRCGRA